MIKNYGCGRITPEPLPPAPPIITDAVLYPNPSSDYITINLPNYTYYELQLYNDYGNLVYDSFGHETSIDVHSMPLGLYTLRIITNDNTINQKLVVWKKYN
jgi:hypothetical protein